MWVAATHEIERNHAQHTAQNNASHTPCKITMTVGRKRTPGSIRLSTRLRPTPETTIQITAAIGASQYNSLATKGLYRANPSLSCAAAIHGFCPLISDRPDRKSGSAVRMECNRVQHTSRNGTPKTQRHRTSSAVIDGR